MEAADTLAVCKAAGNPWEPAKAYDFSSPIGDFIPVIEIKKIAGISFSIYKNNECVAKSNTADMHYGFDDIIAHVSKYITIKTGDYIFTGSPSINESVNINDHIECFIEDKKLLTFRIK